MKPPLLGMRRFSKGSTTVQNRQSTVASSSPPVSYVAPDGPTSHFRPSSSSTTTSFEVNNHTNHANHATSTTLPRPISQPPMPTSNVLSRTDLIVLKHFWADKQAENATRDLHFLKFPFFPHYPEDKDLRPFCEIYHLIKTQPGAKIMGLGTANGVYIGFELFEGSQLHIDMEDEWSGISHFRVAFKSFDKMLADAESQLKSWPKPLTIEFLEEQYQTWSKSLMSVCWDGKEVRELSGGE